MNHRISARSTAILRQTGMAGAPPRPGPAATARRVACLLLALSVIVTALPSASQQADPVAVLLEEARRSCEGFENGAFAANDAVVEVDLTGDGETDRLVDESRLSCSSAASMYCGSGGCMLHAVVGDRTWSFQAEGWRMIDWDGRPILLVARDGGWCGGAGAQVCFEAVVWSFGEVLTVMPPADR